MSIPIDRRSDEDSLMAKKLHRTPTQCHVKEVKEVDVLPDDILLDIFDFYANMSPWDESKTEIEEWQLLVHTPALDTLNVWPALPIIVEAYMDSLSGTENIVAALEMSNRVCEIILSDILDIAGGKLEKLLAAMQMPFPELTDLRLFSDDETLPVVSVPDSLLGGSAPNLQYLELSGILYPGLTRLLLSANHLVTLWLTNIPHSGYISPEAMVGLISGLSSLETIFLGFRSPQSRPDRETRRFSSLKQTKLPALRRLDFKGVTEYFEELVTRIDTPRLEEMDITFFNQIDFDCPRLAQFINRTPNFDVLDEAHVQFDDSSACIILRYWTSESDFNDIRIAISCREQDWQLSSIEQVCNSSLPPPFTVGDLYIVHGYSELVWKNDAIENTLWLQLLRPFTTVGNLFLSREFAPSIVATLEELVGVGITEVLPNLQNIFVEGLESSGPFQKTIGQFVAARELSDNPITISDWVEDSDSTESM